MDKDRDSRKVSDAEHGRLRVRVKELHIDWQMPAWSRLVFLSAVLVGGTLLYLWWPELAAYMVKVASIASK